MEIRRIGVVGAGTMGSGIAQVAAQAGFDVVLVDIVARRARAKGLATIDKSLERLVAKGKLTRRRSAAAARAGCDRGRRSRRSPAATSWSRRWSRRFDVKRQVLARARPACSPRRRSSPPTPARSRSRASRPARRGRPGHRHALHESRCRSCSWSRSSAACRPRRRPTTRSRRRRGSLGKTPVEVHDAPGFVSNRVLMPMINEAIFCLHEGVGKPEAIDEVMKLGMNHPMGPLALADLIGLDVCLDILRVLQDGLRRSEVPALSPAGEDGRRRPPRAQERAWLLCTTAERLPPSVFCQVCGAENPSDQEFCARCHQKLLVISGGAARRTRHSSPSAPRSSRSTSTCSSAFRFSRRRSSGRRRRCRSWSGASTSRRRTCWSRRPDSPPCASCSSAGASIGREEWSDLWESKMDYQLRALEKRERFMAIQRSRRRALSRQPAQALRAASRRRRVRPLRLRRGARPAFARAGFQARSRRTTSWRCSSARPASTRAIPRRR